MENSVNGSRLASTCNAAASAHPHGNHGSNSTVSSHTPVNPTPASQNNIARDESTDDALGDGFLQNYYRVFFPAYVSMLVGYAARVTSPSVPWRVAVEDIYCEHPSLTGFRPRAQRITVTLTSRDDFGAAPLWEMR